MAKYTGSPFGKISGRALDLVASTWKGINYVRQHVIPQNPNTVPQQTQRSKFGNIAVVGRLLVDIILNTYTLPAPKKKSAYNVFVSNNTKLQSTTTLDYAELLLIKGSLYNPGFDQFTPAGDDDLVLDFSNELIGEAKATDIAVGMVYSVKDQKWFIAESDRSGGGVVVNVDNDIEVGDVFYGYLFFADASLTKSSDSIYKIYTHS